MPPTASIGKRLWKSAGTYTRVQQNIDKAVKESEQQEKLSSVRVAVLVPNELLEVVCAAAQGYKVEVINLRELKASTVRDIDSFNNAEILIIDQSDTKERPQFSYRLGVRQVVNHNSNEGVIILFNDTKDNGNGLMLSSDKYQCRAYEMNELGPIAVMEDHHMPLLEYLSDTIKVLAQAAPVNSSREQKFKEDIQKSRSSQLTKLQRLDILTKLEAMLRRDPQMMTVGHLYDIMLSYRELSSWINIIRLYNTLGSSSPESRNPLLRYLVAFALNRRNEVESDREQAMQICNSLLSDRSTQLTWQIDLYGLLGRIHKDNFIESIEKNDRNEEECELAIQAYQKIFEIEDKLYGGVNLLTLMFASEKYAERKSEIDRICMKLNHSIALLGGCSKLTDYWDAASLFEVNCVGGAYGLANEAAVAMLNLAEQPWMIESTMRNIQLIDRLSKQRLSSELSMNVEEVRRTTHDPERLEFEFWCEFFMMVGKETTSLIRFPVFMQNTGVPRPAYVTVQPHTDTEDARIELTPASFVDGTTQDHKQVGRKFSMDLLTHMERISVPFPHNLNAIDNRRLSLAFHTDKGAPMFTLTFPAEFYRSRFVGLCIAGGYDMNKNDESSWTEQEQNILWEFDIVNGDRRVLGTGATATVYSGYTTDTAEPVAIKEMKIGADATPTSDIIEELRTLRHLQHKNIIKFLGFEKHETTMLLIMECVPGGSATRMCYRYGPMWNSKHLTDYCLQILQALVYLHNSDICHRDVKGDNVLVNTYTGVLKMADFGTSKRLAGLNFRTDSVKGTPWFMAPEVIQSDTHDYGRESDIWSFGSTVWQLAMGRPPFVDIRDSGQVMNIVGIYHDTEEIPAEWSPELRNLIRSCWKVSPAERPTADALLKDPFFRPPGKRQSMEQIERADSVQSAVGPRVTFQTVAIACAAVVSPRPNFRRKQSLDNGPNEAGKHRTLCDELAEFVGVSASAIAEAAHMTLQKAGVSMEESVHANVSVPLINALTAFIKQDMAIAPTVPEALLSLVSETERRLGIDKAPTYLHMTRILHLFSKPRKTEALFFIAALKEHDNFAPHQTFAIDDILGRSSDVLADRLKQSLFGPPPSSVELARLATGGGFSRNSSSHETRKSNSDNANNSVTDLDLDTSGITLYSELGEHTQRLLREIADTKRMLTVDLMALRHDFGNPRRRSTLTGEKPAAVDTPLAAMIAQLGLQTTIGEALAQEGITLAILLNDVEKDDLKDVGLPVGPRCVLWQEVLRRRAGAGTSSQ